MRYENVKTRHSGPLKDGSEKHLKYKENANPSHNNDNPRPPRKPLRRR